jgi:signal transduction histidine kinase
MVELEPSSVLLSDGQPEPNDGAGMRQSRGALLGFLFALWSVPGLLYAVQIYEIGLREDRFNTSFLDAMVHALPVWWLWVVVTPIVVHLARRFPIRRSHWVGAAIIHMTAAVVTALVIVGVTSLWFSITPPFDSRDRAFSAWMTALLLSTTLHLYVWCYWLIVAAVHFFDHERRLREQEVAAARLDGLAAQARMQLLANQVQPHFLFNALNGLSTLILRRDTTAAQAMLESLASFLRASLRRGEALFAPLTDELDLIATYLRVESVRWGDRLTVRTEIEPQTEQALVPTLLLQPLVENAVRHGVGASESGGEVLICASRSGSELVLRVENDGAGLTPGWQERATQRVGLENTRQRLALLFGERYTMSLQELGSGRVRLQLEIPYTTTDASEREG